MKHLRFIIFANLLLFSTLSYIGCDNQNNPVDENNSGSYTYTFWLAATKDAHVTSYYPDFNNDGAFSLVCSHGEPNKENRTYIRFFMPQLPEDTEVLEAYINVFEDSESGQPGSGAIHIGTATADWDPYTITWNNQPNPNGPLSAGARVGTFISANMWRTTEDIKLIVQDQLDDPGSNFGWILNNNSVYNFTRSFTSMNALSGRTQTTLQNGPRLLMKVKTNIPLTNSNIGTVVTGSNELGNMYGFNTDIRVFNFESGDTWPEAWEMGTQ